MTEQSAADAAGQRCVEFVELITAYLDGTLPLAGRQRTDAHLRRCEGCRTALAQWLTIVELAGRLTTAQVAGNEPYVRDRLRATFLEVRRR